MGAGTPADRRCSIYCTRFWMDSIAWWGVMAVGNVASM